MMLNVARALNASPQATVLGTSIKTDLRFAAILNGMSSTMWDFDDTLMEAIIHPSAPVFPALVAWSEHAGVPGKRLLQAFVLGVEAEARVGICLGREAHYERGWHITSTAGTFGAAAAIGKLLSLPPAQMQHAMGIASAQAAGLREMFGTSTKPMQVGKAAANGLLAALLAREGLTSAPRPLEGKTGYAYLVSTAPDFRPLQAPWGEELADSSQYLQALRLWNRGPPFDRRRDPVTPARGDGLGDRRHHGPGAPPDSGTHREARADRHPGGHLQRAAWRGGGAPGWEGRTAGVHDRKG